MWSFGGFLAAPLENNPKKNLGFLLCWALGDAVVGNSV